MAQTVIFVVQGEGRGHLSQALAMKSIMSNLHLSIVKVFVGRSSQRLLPEYFVKEFDGLIEEFESPNFLIDEKGKGIKVAKSLWLSFINLPKYISYSIRMAGKVNDFNADLVINFYEPLLGLSQFFKKINAPIVSLAHQFFSLHPKFEMPPKPNFDKNGLKVLSYITGKGSNTLLALSFYKFENYGKRNLKVVPPLLRPALFQLSSADDGYFLIYLLNKGYAQEIIEWQKLNPNTRLEIFWDDFSKPKRWSPQENIGFNHLDANLFLEKMSKCTALISTSGFESVSEALLLNKKVGLVPVKGHYEQKLNSYDALKTGMAVRNDEFDIGALINEIKKMPEIKPSNDWIISGNIMIEEILVQVLNK
ncbi:MAG: UDP- glucuronosyltransferase [Bacteroidia bacterium]